MTATLANASVTSSQISTTLLLTDQPAEMKFGAQGVTLALPISAKLIFPVAINVQINITNNL